MKFFRNYIILILFIIILLLVLQKMEIIPSFSDFLSNAENTEEKSTFIVKSIQEMEDATSVFYIDQISIDTAISGQKIFGIFNVWLQFNVNTNDDFSENMLAMNGKKITISMPLPELNQSLIKFIPKINTQKEERQNTEELEKIASSLSYQNALKDSILITCQRNTEKITENFLKQMGFKEIKIDFIQNIP